MFAGFTAPAQAGSRIIAQKTAKSAKVPLVLNTGLDPRHAYRVQVVAGGHVHASALALQQYYYVIAGRLGTGAKTRQLRGTTPVSSRFTPPLAKGLRAWSIEVQVQPSRNTVYTVRVVDLGKTN